MESVIFIAASILLVGAILFFSLFYNKKATVKRKLKNTPKKRIRDVMNGEYAKITGNVEIIGESILAPLSNRKCAYYYIHIEQLVSTGKSSHWKTLVEEEVSGNFVIKEGNSFAFILNEKIKSCIVEDRKYSSGFSHDATPELEYYLGLHGFKSENILGFNKKIRYLEGILESNEEVAVMGRCVWTNASQLKIPEYYGKVLAISPDKESSIYLSDVPETIR